MKEQDYLCDNCGDPLSLCECKRKPIDTAILCEDCGKEINEDEGSTFTCCNECWDKYYKKQPPSDSLALNQLIDKYIAAERNAEHNSYKGIYAMFVKELRQLKAGREI